MWTVIPETHSNNRVLFFEYQGVSALSVVLEEIIEREQLTNFFEFVKEAFDGTFWFYKNGFAQSEEISRVPTVEISLNARMNTLMVWFVPNKCGITIPRETPNLYEMLVAALFVNEEE